ncbi:MAG: cysteine desulfurase [Planctomycetaceae bacterium]|nr:cysteine desulfurase [Planctomycetaceae bacterium]
MIYLDNNSTTRLAPEVWTAMSEAWSNGLVNPASQHRGGQRARRALEDAREAILRHLGARTAGMRPDRLIFTSGGTEANNLALTGLVQPNQQVLISAIEHPSIFATARHLSSMNIDVRQIPVDHDGVVCLDRLGELLRERPTCLVAVMAANNETGVIQPVSDVARLAHDAGALVHCDAVQWVNKLPTLFSTWDVDCLSLSCHKFHGPVGIGALCLKHGVTPRPLFFGGFQEDGLRPGTVALPLVLGFAAAVRLFEPGIADSLQSLRDHLELSLAQRLPIVVNGSAALRLPHTSNVAFLGRDRQALLLAADRHDLCLSTGSACSSGSSERSPVLLAMGLPANVLDSSLRLSIARDTTLAEVDQAIDILTAICSS